MDTMIELDERAPEMAALYTDERLTFKEIGERYGLTKQRVHQILAPLNLERHHGQRKRDERVDRLTEAYERIVAGDSTTVEEADRLGYASAAILRGAFSDLGFKRPPQDPPPHGTTARYTSRSHPCRCDLCLEAMREKARARHKRGPEEHGTMSGYKNFGCRCPACSEANREYERELRTRRKEAA